MTSGSGAGHLRRSRTRPLSASPTVSRSCGPGCGRGRRAQGGSQQGAVKGTDLGPPARDAPSSGISYARERTSIISVSGRLSDASATTPEEADHSDGDDDDDARNDEPHRYGHAALSLGTAYYRRRQERRSTQGGPRTQEERHPVRAFVTGVQVASTKEATQWSTSLLLWIH